MLKIILVHVQIYTLQRRVAYQDAQQLATFINMRFCRPQQSVSCYYNQLHPSNANLLANCRTLPGGPAAGGPQDFTWLRDTSVGMPADKETAAAPPAEGRSPHSLCSLTACGRSFPEVHCTYLQVQAKVSELESQVNPVSVLYL